MKNIGASDVQWIKLIFESSLLNSKTSTLTESDNSLSQKLRQNLTDRPLPSQNSVVIYVCLKFLAKASVRISYSVIKLFVLSILYIVK